MFTFSFMRWIEMVEIIVSLLVKVVTSSSFKDSPTSTSEIFSSTIFKFSWPLPFYIWLNSATLLTFTWLKLILLFIVSFAIFCWHSFQYYLATLSCQWSWKIIIFCYIFFHILKIFFTVTLTELNWPSYQLNI